MNRVTLASQTDFEGWRTAARSAVLADIPPELIVWGVAGEAGDLLGTEDLHVALDGMPAVAEPRFNVSKTFVALAGEVVCHSDPERFALLYRLLWRLRGAPQLLADAADRDVDRARALAKAIHRDVHKMHAFVRFREVAAPDGEPAYIAWFEPEHYIVEAVGDFFVRRFTGMRWSILTPHRSAFWDGDALTYGPGADKAQVPDADRLEAYWRTYYASIFNPARLKVAAMQKEMPKKYWKNLPEAQLIGGLIRDAGTRTAGMLDAEPTPRSPLAQALDRQASDRLASDRQALDREMLDAPRDANGEDPMPADLLSPERLDPDMPATLEAAREAAARCTRCDLHGPATQTVFGEGPQTAEILFVGEQPGDKEDLAGHPFVGPAGAMLNKALKEAGIERDKAYITNAVKHFKYEPRGKFRLHKKPDSKEISACRYWLDVEKSLLAPKIIVALGASAGQALLGRTVKIGAERGKPIPQGNEAPVFITVHPSYLLRLPDEEMKRKEYARFVEDLSAARTAAGI